MSEPRNYNVGWICCTRTEFTAAQAFLDEEHLPPKALPSHDRNIYVLGRIRGHNVVISFLTPDYITSATAEATTNMLQSFPNVRFNLIVGISSGAPSSQHDIRLGDIVVGIDGVITLHSGKLIQRQSFQPMSVPDRPSTFLRVAITKLQTRYDLFGSRLEEAVDEVLEKSPNLRKDYQRPNEDSDRLYHSQVIHPPESGSICAEVCGNDATTLVLRHPRYKVKDDLAVHYGMIASSDIILKDAIIRDKLSAEMDVLCFYMDAAAVTSQLPCLMIRGICDYSDSHKNKQWQGYAAMIAAAYARDLLHRIVPLQVEIEERTQEDLDLNFALDRLPLATGAEYHPYMDQDDDLCLPGTRIDLLKQIKEWTFSPDERSIFWLNGWTETGKSTISRTLAQSLKNSKNLGASFFFKRGEGDRGNAKKFVSTLARQLVLEFPDLIVGVQNALRDDPGVASKSLEQQFEKLLFQPLLQLKQLNRKPQVAVIVIDALDECGNHQDILRIIRWLPHLDSIGAVRFRIFVTSLPTFPIASSFAERSSTSYQRFSLHEVPNILIEHDMRLFLESQFADIRLDKNITQDWPGVNAIQTLVKFSVPFFFFTLAVHVCRVLKEPQVNAVGTLAKIILLLNENSKLNETVIANRLVVVQRDFNELINKSIMWERQESGSGGRETEDGHKDSLCDPSGIESIFSTESFLSSQSSQSEITSIAISELTNLLLNDDDLKSLYPIAISKVGPERFQRNLARMLKGYGQILSSEASSEVQRQAAKFVRLSARQISVLIRTFLTQDSELPIQPELDVSKSALVGVWMTSQMKLSSNSKDDANEISSDSDSTSSESEHRSSLSTLEEVKVFMVSTRAFPALRQELREWLEVKKKNCQENEESLSIMDTARNIMRGLNLIARTSTMNLWENEETKKIPERTFKKLKISARSTGKRNLDGSTKGRSRLIVLTIWWMYTVLWVITLGLLQPIFAELESTGIVKVIRLSYWWPPLWLSCWILIVHSRVRPRPDNIAEPGPTKLHSGRFSKVPISQSVENIAAISSGMGTMIRVSMWWLRLRTIFAPPAANYQRISYICGCGELSYLDIRELSTGGIERFRRKLLNSVAAVKTTPHTSSVSGPVQPPPQAHLNPHSRSNTRSQNTVALGVPHHFSPQPVPAEDIQDRMTTSQDQDSQFVLLCMNAKGSTVLVHIEVSFLTNDQYFFQKIYQEYQTHCRDNGFKLSMLVPPGVSKFLRSISKRLPQLPSIPRLFHFPSILFSAFFDMHIHKIESGDFVRFSLIPIGTKSCPSWFKAREFPPEVEVKSKRYLYEPVPMADVELYQIPLQHLLKPGPHTDRFWMTMIPKKLQEPLVRLPGENRHVVGWGVRMNESLNWVFILPLILVILLAVGVSVIIYAAVTSDNSSAFGLGAFLVSIFTVYFTYQYFAWQDDI